MVLPGGDWLASVNGSIVRLSPDGTDVRWAQTGLDIWEAIPGAEARVVAIGTIADPKALNGAAHSLFALETATGALVWRTDAGPIVRYAANGEELALRIVDLSRSRARRVPILRTAKEHSSVQLIQLSVRADQISFAGEFTGHASPLKARVEEVDECDAQHGVECFGPGGTVTLSPLAGVIGTVAFPRPPAR